MGSSLGNPPVPSPTRSTASNGTASGDHHGGSSRGGSADRSNAREDATKSKYAGLGKGDRPAVPVPTSSSIPQRPGHRGRSLDLGLGLAWAPSKLKEEALLPHTSLFARSVSKCVVGVGRVGVWVDERGGSASGGVN
ncbi:hypothetical protein NMY22_g13057 [Coprinellus aureogranulatus]|nr:hypothetical protein NMY22_g13057 [Coprinellus aureogranulatus]